MLSVIFDNLGLIATGAAGAGVGIVGIKGVPASWAWLKAKLNSAKSGLKADLAAAKADAASAQTAVAALEQKFAPQLTALRADVDALKAKGTA